MTRMISRTLSIALKETIQQHAETFHDGKIEVEGTLIALCDVASAFIAELPDLADRDAHFGALLHRIRTDTHDKREKLVQRGEHTTQQ
jgi:hypothetical protein